MSYILNILPIEDDELMSSYFRRMAQVNGFKDPINFMQSYIWTNSEIDSKQKRTIRDDGFNVMTNFNKCFGDKESDIRFFLNTSLFPGIRPVISNASAILLYVFRDNTDDINIIPKRFVQKTCYCPVCAQNDMKTKGFSWIRRSHNMSGVKVCYKHHCYLLNVDSELEIDKDVKYCDNQIESEYAIFVKKMLFAAIDCDSQQTIEAIKNKITELGYNIPAGGYSDFLSDISKNGYRDFLPKNTEYILKVGKNSVVNSSGCEVMLKLLFVIFKTPDNFQPYIQYDNAFTANGYTIIEYADGIFKLLHKCGNIFIVSKELFDKGWRCSCYKKSKEQNLVTHIKEASNNQYEIAGFNGTHVKLIHKLCKKEQTYRIVDFVLGDTRCICNRKKPVKDVKTNIETIKDFKLLLFTSVNQPLLLKHKTCGKTFSVDYYSFLKAPFCRACLQNKIGFDIKITPRSINESSEEAFVQDISDLVGDEYSFVGPYAGDNQYTYIKHNKCHTIEKYIPSHFRQGMRCKKCAVKTSYDGFRRYVHDLTNGEYEITGQEKNRYFRIKNIKTGNEYSLQKTVILQELNRVQPSWILPVRKRQNKDIAEDGIVYNLNVTWEFIQSHFQQKDLFSASDVDTSNAILGKLAQNGKIKKIVTGLYTFPGNNATAIDVIKYRYFEKYGIRFGYWFGQSFAYHLGIIDKTKTIYIATNRMQTANRSNYTVLGQPIVLRKPVDTITEENYKVLTVIDYLTTYKNGPRGTKRTNKEQEIAALRNYIKNISRDEFKVYADKCMNKDKLNTWLDLIYGNGLLEHIKAEYDEGDLFYPDDIGTTDAEMLTLVKAGELQKVYKHLYAFPNKNASVEDIIKYKYLEQHNTIYGYWYGESFMYSLGISKKPEKCQIASFAITGNPYHYRYAVECNVLNQKITIRKPLTTITKENYKIICIIDFISEYGIGSMKKNYFYPKPNIDLEMTLTVLARYLEGINRSEFDQYSYLVKNQVMFDICLDMIYMHSE